MMVTERTVDLLKYLPPYLKEYLEMYSLICAENPEFQFVASNCKKVLNNTFIMYCDKDGIQRFENLLNIVASESETLESRQSRVMIKWNDNVPYTLKALINKLIAVQGNNDIQIIINGYEILIITHMDNAGQSETLWDLFNKMIPCNMDISHQNLVRCNTSGIVFIAAGTNYARTAVNEFTQWFGAKGMFYVAAGTNYGRTAVNEFIQHFNSTGILKLGVGVSYSKVSVNEYIQEFTAKGSIKIASGISYARMTANDYIQEFCSKGNVYIASGLNCGRIAVNEYTQQFTTSGKIYIATGTKEVRMMVNDYVQAFTSKGNANLGVGISNTEIIKIY